MIIDCHCHAGKGDRMTAPWNTDAPIEPYLRRARAAGIDKTIVFPLFHSDYAKANAQLAELVKRHRSRLIGFAFIHAARDAGRVFSMVRRAVICWGFRGIKVHGHEAMATREVCETAQAFGLLRMGREEYLDELVRALEKPMTRDLAREYLIETAAAQRPALFATHAKSATVRAELADVFGLMEDRSAR